MKCLKGSMCSRGSKCLKGSKSSIGLVSLVGSVGLVGLKPQTTNHKSREAAKPQTPNSKPQILNHKSREAAKPQTTSHFSASLNNSAANHILTFVKHRTLSGCNTFYIIVKYNFYTASNCF